MNNITKKVEDRIPLALLYLSGGFVIASTTAHYALDLTLKIFIIGVISSFIRQVYKDIKSFGTYLEKKWEFWWNVHYLLQFVLLVVLLWVIVSYKV